MRISIWQQFSSNHSANFTVVGIFQTPEQAGEKAELFRKIIADIQEAIHQLEIQRRLPDSYEPIPIEVALSKEFGVEWKRSLDWAWQIEYAVRQIDNYVVVQNVLGQTWNGPHPIDQLMEKFGAQTLIGQEIEGSHIEIDVSAIAPDEETVNAIFSELLPLFDSAILEYDGGRYLDFTHLTAPWESFAEKVQNEGIYFDQSNLYDGLLKKDDLRLNLTQLHFHAIGIGLPALIKYLKARGAIDVQYSMRQKR